MEGLPPALRVRDADTAVGELRPVNRCSNASLQAQTRDDSWDFKSDGLDGWDTRSGSSRGRSQDLDAVPSPARLPSVGEAAHRVDTAAADKRIFTQACLLSTENFALHPALRSGPPIRMSHDGPPCGLRGKLLSNRAMSALNDVSSFLHSVPITCGWAFCCSGTLTRPQSVTCEGLDAKLLLSCFGRDTSAGPRASRFGSISRW